MMDREQAWTAHINEIERASIVLACGTMMILTPAWSIVDWLLLPSLAASFLPVRAAATALSGLALAYCVYGHNPALRRVLAAVATLGLGAAVAWMLSKLDGHAFEYILGFSLIFWAVGIVARWPATYTAVILSALLVIDTALGYRTGVGPPWEGYGVTFYLASAGGISTSVNALWRRIERRTFDARFDLAARNDELGATLTRLGDAQARLLAQDRLSALGRLVAQLSHEINNPLNVVQNNLGPVTEYAAALGQVVDAACAAAGEEGDKLRTLCEANDVNFARQDIGDALAAMAVATARISDINANLRTFLRGDTVDFVLGDLNEAVRSSVAIWRRSVPNGITVTESYGPIPPFPLIPGQASQIALNLMQNAMDAVGGEGDIEVSTWKEGDFAVIAVSDNGTGLTAEAQTHLFEPFFTTKAVGKGTGLGLATCYQIAQRHGGTLSLDAAHQPGARFLARLPIGR